MRRYIFLTLLSIIIAGCGKGSQPEATCGVKACTYQFASVTINFVNNANQPQDVNNFSAINQRTGLEVERSPSLSSSLHTFTLADDNKLSQFSTDGDNVLITATALNQTKTALVKIAGGCNCHVEKKSGPQIIKFD